VKSLFVAILTIALVGCAGPKPQTSAQAESTNLATDVLLRPGETLKMRIDAAVALATTEPGLAKLLSASMNAESDIRVAAAAGLGLLQDQKAVNRLEDMLSDPSEPVEHQALVSLRGKELSKKGVASVSGLSHSKNAGISADADKLLRARGNFRSLR
jgi:HEAT repeat protein